MKKLVFITSVLFFSSILLAAQGNPRGKTPAQPPTLFTEGNRITQLIKEKIIDQGKTGNKSVNTEVIGNAYLNENFRPGKILLGKKEIGAYMLRYNVFAEEFETPQSEGVAIVYKSSEVEVEMDGTSYIFKYYLNEDRKEFGYFEVIKEYKKITLLKKYRKVLQEGKTAVTSFDVKRPNRLVDLENYFIMINNNDILFAKQSNRGLANELKNYNIDLKPYLKEKRLNVKKEEDFFKVISFIDNNIN